MAGNKNSGRKSAPNHLKIHREKNRGRINQDEPQPLRAIPKCPPGRTPAFRAAWKKFGRIMADMDVMTAADGGGLEGLCDAWVAYRQSVKLSEKQGPVVTLPDGTTKINPTGETRRRDWNVVMKLLTEYGMTPYSRSGLKTLSAKKMDPLEAFISEGTNG